MKKFNFYRERDMFAYVRGNVNFGENTQNILVISENPEVKIKNIKNSFIHAYEDKMDIYPISDIEKTLQRSEELLGQESVVYHKPKSVSEREYLDKKNIEDLARNLSSDYGIIPESIGRVGETQRSEGVFEIKDCRGHTYILKHWGKSNDRLNALAKIANSSNGIFPRIFPTKMGSYSIQLSDGYYGLEEFIDGKTRERTNDYFTKTGEAMAIMHEGLNRLFLRDNELRALLLSKSRSVGDSNIVSLWIDSTLSGYPTVAEEVKKFGNEKLKERINVSPESYIHGDLNNSNIIWTNNGPRFIDIETVRLSRRIFDIEATSLLPGNMGLPEYIPGSLDCLVGGYNGIAKDPLSEDEIDVSRRLMEYSLIRNFVIRNIRRDDKNNSLKKLNDNLRKIQKDR